MSRVSRVIDRIEVTFDDETLVADAGLIVPATLMMRLGLEAFVNQTVRLVGLLLRSFGDRARPPTVPHPDPWSDDYRRFGGRY